MQQTIVDCAHAGVESLDSHACIGVNLTLIEHVLQAHDQNACRKSLGTTPSSLNHCCVTSRCNGDANNNNQNNTCLPLLLNKNNPSIKELTRTHENGLEELEPSLLQQYLMIKAVTCIMKVIDDLQHLSVANCLMEGSLGNNLFCANSRSNSVDDHRYPNHLHIRHFSKSRD